MKMQHFYGVFDNEADHIIDLVRSHAPLALIRGTGCPACGAEMSVEFAEGGQGFQVSCKGTPLHFSKHQDIADPPPWWRECFTPLTASNYYWREWHSFGDSGNLVIMMSGYTAEGDHWSGELRCSSNDPDYSFWRWVLFQSACTSDLIDDEELAGLRVQFAKTPCR